MWPGHHLRPLGPVGATGCLAPLTQRGRCGAASARSPPSMVALEEPFEGVADIYGTAPRVVAWLFPVV